MQPPRSMLRLSDLPLEVLIMILEELGWRDVLQLRKTCTVLHEASKTRNIWLNLCQGYLAPSITSPQMLHLERPVWMYSAQELEFLFLRLQGAEIGWRKKVNSPARTQTIATTNSAVRMHLVEGGRWLLVMSKTGSVTYLDLDSPTMTETMLISDQADDPTPEVWRDITTLMVVDMNRASPFLAFNIAFSFCSSHPREHKIQIWHVEHILDDQQLGVGLRSKHMATFLLDTNIPSIHALSLLGPHVAFCVRSIGQQKTFVVDWESANDSLNYSRRQIHGVEAYSTEPPARVVKLMRFPPVGNSGRICAVFGRRLEDLLDQVFMARQRGQECYSSFLAALKAYSRRM